MQEIRDIKRTPCKLRDDGRGHQCLQCLLAISIYRTNIEDLTVELKDMWLNRMGEGGEPGDQRLFWPDRYNIYECWHAQIFVVARLRLVHYEGCQTQVRTD